MRQQHGQSAPAVAAVSGAPEEADLLAEAKLLRQHKGRLEARMQILEDHNSQLESQLYRLRQLLHQVTTHPNGFAKRHLPVSKFGITVIGAAFICRISRSGLRLYCCFQ